MPDRLARVRKDRVRKARPKAVVDSFHELYYRSLGWDRNFFLGHRIKQCPFGLQLYQELVHRVRPRFIIQTGVAAGGSVIFLASVLDLVSVAPDAVVVGIDTRLSAEARRLAHPRLRLVEGDSTDPETVRAVKALVPRRRVGLVSLDSDHTASHVRDELRIYRDFLGVGSYLVVEDTNLNGHPVFRKFGPGPHEAVRAFLRSDRRFVADDELWRRNLFSFHRWLRRVR